MAIDPKKIEEWKALLGRAEHRYIVWSSIDANGNQTSRQEPVTAYLVREAIPALLSEREEMLAVLREVEWASATVPSSGACPICDVDEPGPHKPDCRLAALLCMRDPDAT